MNDILLDTHIWLWFAEGSRRLNKNTITLIEDMTKEGKTFISVISIWELGLLTEKNRLHLSLPVREWLEQFLSIMHIRVLCLEPDVALEANLLPGKLHADPADRLIIATARQHNLKLLTQDKQILEYGQQGFVRICPQLKT